MFCASRPVDFGWAWSSEVIIFYMSSWLHYSIISNSPLRIPPTHNRKVWLGRSLLFSTLLGTFKLWFEPHLSYRRWPSPFVLFSCLLLLSAYYGSIYGHELLQHHGGAKFEFWGIFLRPDHSSGHQMGKRYARSPSRHRTSKIGKNHPDTKSLFSGNSDLTFVGVIRGPLTTPLQQPYLKRNVDMLY